MFNLKKTANRILINTGKGKFELENDFWIRETSLSLSSCMQELDEAVYRVFPGCCYPSPCLKNSKGENLALTTGLEYLPDKVQVVKTMETWTKERIYSSKNVPEVLRSLSYYDSKNVSVYEDDSGNVWCEEPAGEEEVLKVFDKVLEFFINHSNKPFLSLNFTGERFFLKESLYRLQRLLEFIPFKNGLVNFKEGKEFLRLKMTYNEDGFISAAELYFE